MPRSTGNSPKAHRDYLRERMHALGCSMAQIAVEMGRRFDLRPRLAWRYALGWPQWKVAQHYNILHPGARLAETRVSDYENWPNGGHPPTPRYLAGLAATYGHGCTPAHLVDLADLEKLTPDDRILLTTPPNPYPPAAASATASPALPATAPAALSALSAAAPSSAASAGLVVPPGAVLVVADPAWATQGCPLPEALALQFLTQLASLATHGPGRLTTPRERDRAYDRLVQLLRSWAHTVDRRNLLRVLGLAATAAAALPALDSDASQRLASVLTHTTRVDLPAIEHLEAILWHCRLQDRALGPRGVLDTVLAQRDLARALLPDCPAALRPRLFSALSEASRQAGWLSLDLQRFDHAGYYYEDARALAHDAENTALGAFVLCQMSQLATGHGMARTGIDHAVAAGQWAQHTDDMRLRAFAADVLARAYAADGQKDSCLTQLDTAHTTLTAVGDHNPNSVPFYDEALHISFRGECHLKLRDSKRAAEYLQQSLETLNPSGVRDRAITLIDLGTAHAQCKEIDEAARLFGEAGDLAAGHSSVRLVERLKQARAELEPWKDSAAVRQLDDRLASHSTA